MVSLRKINRLKSVFFRLLSIFYAVGFALHLADIFDLRLRFSQMDWTFKAWIAFLAVADLIASIGLWALNIVGVFVFFLVATAQLIAYLGFPALFGQQNFLIFFHLVSLFIFGTITILQKIAKNTEKRLA